MASDTDAARVIVEQLLRAAFAEREEPLFFDGTDFGTPSDTNWLEAAVLFGEAFEDTMGGAGAGGNMIVGVVNVNIFGPRGVGYGDLDRIADIVRNVFNRLTSSGVRFSAPSPAKRITTEGATDLQVNVSCAFEFDETI